MAHMNQAKKAVIKTELKKVMPKDWKWSLGIGDHVALILTIKSAPVSLLKMQAEFRNKRRGEKPGYLEMYGIVKGTGSCRVNVYYLDGYFEGAVLKTFKKIKSAMDIGNYDRSNIMTGRHDVGHYVEINLGSRKKDFAVNQ